MRMRMRILGTSLIDIHEVSPYKQILENLYYTYSISTIMVDSDNQDKSYYFRLIVIYVLHIRSTRDGASIRIRILIRE